MNSRIMIWEGNDAQGGREKSINDFGGETRKKHLKPYVWRGK